MTMPASSKEPQRQQRGPVSSFFRSLFSHLLFSGLVVAGVLGYLYHASILRDVGDTVCADQVLGQWRSPSQTIASAHANASNSDASTTSKPAPLETHTASSPKIASAPSAAEAGTPANDAGRQPDTRAADATTKIEAPVNGSTNTPATKDKAAPVSPQKTAPEAERVAESLSESVVKNGVSPAASAQSPPVAQQPNSNSEQSDVTTANEPAIGDAAKASAADGTALAPSPTQSASSESGPAMASNKSTSTARTNDVASSGDAPSTSPDGLPKAQANETSASPSPTATASLSPRTNEAPREHGQSAANKISANEQMIQAWMQARQAYSEGKTETTAAYIDLVKRYPEEPQISGELGNIYFQQRKMPEAAAQYLETAQRLVRRGQQDAASCLVDAMTNLDLLRHLDSAKVQSLKASVHEPCPAPPQQQN